MNKSFITLTAASLVGMGALFASIGAQASPYYIDQSTSKMLVMRLGGNNIDNRDQFNPYNPVNGTRNPSNPLDWYPMIGNMGTWPIALDFTGGNQTPTGINNIAVGGSLDVTGGLVTAGTINQLETLFMGTLQTAPNSAFIATVGGQWVYTGNGTTNNPGVVTNLVTNGLVWTYDAGLNTLTHQAQAGMASCQVAVINGLGMGGATGTQTSGQCSTFVTPINSSTAASIWNWTGVAAPGTVSDAQTTPWHTGTGQQLTTGALSAVQWDLSGFVDGQGGIIKALVTSDAASGANLSLQAAVYELHVVPVPAAVWLFGSALGLMGLARRRQAVA